MFCVYTKGEREMLINKEKLLKEVDDYYDLNYGEVLINPTRFYDMVDEQPTVEQPQWNDISVIPTTYERLITMCSDGYVKMLRYYNGMFINMEKREGETAFRCERVDNVIKWTTLESLLNTIKEESK